MRRRPRTKYVGVYGIRHVPTGAMYVGGSTDITGRYTHHRFWLRRGLHKSKPLQELWAACGEREFEFITLELCDASVLIEREDEWIKSTAQCLNGVAGAVTGNFTTPSEAKKAAARKRWATPSYRAKRQGWLDERGSDGRFLPREARGAL